MLIWFYFKSNAFKIGSNLTQATDLQDPQVESELATEFFYNGSDIKDIWLADGQSFNSNSI